MPLSRSELIDRIWAAYKSATLENVYVGDEAAMANEYAEAAKFFKTHTREELASDYRLIPTTWANWNHISAAAWRYFLPGYLIAALDPEAVDLRETVLNALSPSGRADYLLDIFLDRMTLLTLGQRSAVEAWFDYAWEAFGDELAANSNAATAYRFWHDEMGIANLVDTFEPDPTAWRTLHGSYPWMSQKR